MGILKKWVIPDCRYFVDAEPDRNAHEWEAVYKICSAVNRVRLNEGMGKVGVADCKADAQKRE